MNDRLMAGKEPSNMKLGSAIRHRIWAQKGGPWCSDTGWWPLLYRQTDTHQGQEGRSSSVISSKYDYITFILVRLLLVLCCTFEHTSVSSPQLCVPYSPNTTNLLPNTATSIKLKQKVREMTKYPYAWTCRHHHMGALPLAWNPPLY